MTQENTCDGIGRIVGLDVGDKRIGVAVSDPLGITAQPRDVIQRTSLDKDIEAVRAVIEANHAVRIVVGLPLTNKGEVGYQANKVLEFVESLRQALGVDIVTQDERFTSAAAERSLIDADVRRKRRKQVIDTVAAQGILRTYLDRQAHQRKHTAQ